MSNRIDEIKKKIANNKKANKAHMGEVPKVEEEVSIADVFKPKKNNSDGSTPKGSYVLFSEEIQMKLEQLLLNYRIKNGKVIKKGEYISKLIFDAYQSGK